MDRKLIERVAWYVFGVALGLMLLGFVQMKRSQAHQQRMQQEQAVQPTPGSGATVTEPAPGR